MGIFGIFPVILMSKCLLSSILTLTTVLFCYISVPVGHIASKFLEHWLELMYLGETTLPQGDRTSFIAQLFIKEDEVGIFSEGAFAHITIKNHYERLTRYLHECIYQKRFTDVELICMYLKSQDKWRPHPIHIHRIMLAIFSSAADQLLMRPEYPIRE